LRGVVRGEGIKTYTGKKRTLGYQKIIFYRSLHFFIRSDLMSEKTQSID